MSELLSSSQKSSYLGKGHERNRYGSECEYDSHQSFPNQFSFQVQEFLCKVLHTIRCLFQSNGIVIRSKTHEAQTAPAEKREEAKAWVVTVVPILTQPNCHQDWIANMDQTPVPFTMTPKTTLNEQGSRTVNGHSSTGSTMWLTLAVSVTASCKKLTWQTQQMHYEGVFKSQLQIPSNMVVQPCCTGPLPVCMLMFQHLIFW